MVILQDSRLYKLMKILFDHQIFRLFYGGASKYFAMMINSLPKDTWEIASMFTSNEYIREKRLKKTVPYLFKGQALLYDYINRPITMMKLCRGNYDVFHQTDYGTYCLDYLGSRPMVTTYHDSNLSTIDPHPEIVTRQALSIKRADAIICVSENTRKDMLNLFNVDEHKAHVIYHGIETPDMSTLPSERIVKEPYILYVGRRSAYKNFKRFAIAFSKLSKTYDGIKLVCTSRPFNKEEIEIFAKLGISNKVVHISASEQMMQCLYRDALFFVFPSLYEGFGMPILEAWSCHCPVLLSNTSCFPEIAGEAGLYFEPTSVDDIHDAMSRAIDNGDIRKSLIAKGNERVKAFSWQRCADKHMKVYKSLV